MFNDCIKLFQNLGDAKADWWIVQEIANRLGADWNYSHPSEIFAEMASLSPLFSQANYEVTGRLGQLPMG